MSKIISIATAVPAYQHKQQDIFEFANAIHSDSNEESRKLRFLYGHSGISTRYSIIPDYSCAIEERKFYSKERNLEPFPNLEKRMEWFSQYAGKLSVEAINGCISGKIKSEAITHLITVSCTGLSAPGLDLEIMETMNLPQGIFRTSVNFMGCYAAVHALRMADAICKNEKNASVVVVCTELCTLHFQKDKTVDNITSTLLFADGCAAVLVQHDESIERGFILESFFSNVAFNGKKDMAWQLSSRGFLMTLTGYVPELLKEDFDNLVSAALHKAGIKKEEINYWCMHPGGKKILEAISQSLQLKNGDLDYCYKVLNDYGNMSSPTILFVLKRILDDINQQKEGKGKKIFGAAFGPGLTMETFIATHD